MTETRWNSKISKGILASYDRNEMEIYYKN